MQYKKPVTLKDLTVLENIIVITPLILFIVLGLFMFGMIGAIIGGVIGGGIAGLIIHLLGKKKEKEKNEL